MIGDGGGVATPMSDLARVAGGSVISRVVWGVNRCWSGVQGGWRGGSVVMIRGWIWREAGNVLSDGPSFGSLINGNKFPEEFSVPECLPA